MNQTLIITPGETDGVGLEITLKSLSQIQTKNHLANKSFIFFASKKHLDEHLDAFQCKGLKILELDSLRIDLDSGVYWINSQESSFKWFQDSVEFCNKHPKQAALITGPLRKSSFVNALGHTDYLRKKFQGPCFMTFFGETYNSLLLSDHSPLNEVSNLDFNKLLNEALEVLKKIPKTKKMALLGLNPHAGEDGLIGTIDEDIHKPFATRHKELIEGPLPADSFFSKETYQKYSFLICNYHDQALIPFKLIHGFNGAQASLGLPFVRTSVDHGTGDALYLKNQANPKSMFMAIELAVRLLNSN